MTQAQNHPTQQKRLTLTTSVYIGAAIGVILISIFLLKATNADPAWGRYWRIRPVVLMTFAGGMGGLCNYLIFRFHKEFGVPTFIAAIIGALVFFVGLWMGFVLGLDGTYWD